MCAAGLSHQRFEALISPQSSKVRILTHPDCVAHPSICFRMASVVPRPSPHVDERFCKLFVKSHRRDLDGDPRNLVLTGQ